jgi:FtsP/CotA-like multicopper oxidase with cupredoxin domain
MRAATINQGIDMSSRRDFFKLTGAVAAATVTTAALASLPEIVSMDKPATQPPLTPPNGRPYNPVVTLNGWTLPWRMKDGVKEFHLMAEPVVREIAPGMKMYLWSYNGQNPGPTIEVVEGDRVRIFVTNRLPEHTTVHWRGQRLPNGMDGVGGLNQPQIKPGKTFVYEFVARRPGTFMYHPRADEMTPMAMGMMGFWVTHLKGRPPLSKPSTAISASCSAPTTSTLAVPRRRSTPYSTSICGRGTAAPFPGSTV